MGRSDSDLKEISTGLCVKQRKRDSTINMIFKRIILCSIFLAVVILAAESNGEKNSEIESRGRVIRAPGKERGEKSNGRRKKKVGGGRRRAGRRRSNRRGKGRGGKGNRKSGRRRSKTLKGGRKRSRNVDLRSTSGLNETCFTQAIFFLKLWKDTVANYKKQKTRMTKQNTQGSGKSGKKGEFAPVALRLVDIGGGNKTNMSCGGTYGNKGAMQLQNLTKTLFDCEIAVNKSCNLANFPKPNTTLITLCDTLVSSFINETGSCIGKSIGSSKTNVSDACGCWLGPKLNKTAQSIKSCKTSSSAKAITTQLNKCKTTFGVCRKYEDDAITAILSCVTSSSAQTAKAATLSVNNATMTAAKAKMSSLASNSTRRIRTRATAVTCAEVITKSKTVISYASSFPSSSKIATIAREISSASVTCTATEKTSLKTQVTSMESAILTVSSALTVIQEQIKTISGSTASSAQLTTSVTTSSPARRGKNWIKS